MKKIQPAILLFLICTALSFYSCDTTPTPEVITITPDKLDVNQLEVVTLSTENINFNEETYTGTIAGEQVIIANYESKLVLQIPEIAPGYHILQANIEGHPIEINYNVALLAPIADPNAYIQNAITEFTYSSTYLTDLHTATANMYGASYNAANEIILNDYVAQLQNQITIATPQGIDSLAKFMAANGDIFSPLDDIIVEIDSLNLNRAYDFPEVKLLYAKLVTHSKCVIALGMVSASVLAFYAHPLLGYAGLVASAYYIYSVQKSFVILFDKSNLQTGELGVVDVFRTENEFNNGAEYTFEITSSYRNLNNQDVSSTSPVISSIVGSLNDFTGYWNKLMSLIPAFLSPLQGTPFHLNNISTTQFQTLAPKPSCLSIANISNSNVTASIDNTGDALRVTFNTTQTVDQNFTFDIVYNHVNVSTHSTNFSGTVLSSSRTPANGTIVNNPTRTVVFTWPAVSGANSYQLDMRFYDHFLGYSYPSYLSPSIFLDATTLQGDLPGMGIGLDYYTWRILALDNFSNVIDSTSFWTLESLQ